LHDANVAGGFSYTCVVEDDEHSENILSLAADTEYSLIIKMLLKM